MMELSKEYLKMRKQAAQENSDPLWRARDGIRIEIAVTGNRGSDRGTQQLLAAMEGKKVRHVFIEAQFPELKGGAMYQTAIGEASTTKPAIARAFRALLKTIPRKRVSVIKATISITTKIVEDSNVKV